MVRATAARRKPAHGRRRVFLPKARAMTSAFRVPLAPMTTLGLGGCAARVDDAFTEADVHEAFVRCARAHEPLAVVGGGSNLIVPDEGFPGTVLRVRDESVRVARDGDAVRVRVGAGLEWGRLVERACAEGWAGLECLAGIPGSVGAAPIQNIGAYGQEVGESIEGVRFFDRRTGSFEEWSAAACAFGYRDSRFKREGHAIVTEVTFRFPRARESKPLRYAELTAALGVGAGATAPLATVASTVIALRRKKGMVLDASDPDSRSAGSFFVNPILDAEALAAFLERLARDGVPAPTLFPALGDAKKVPAAWLIEKAGFTKGQTFGAFRISSKHALALVHVGGGTAGELLAVADRIVAGVRARFGIALEREPVLLVPGGA
jgi:UDP-N-acetylmuramate dehydrogenase